MGTFATQFEVALREMKFRQIDIVHQARVTQTQVSRYLSGHVLPEGKSLEAIAAIFPEDIRARLVTAYLIDRLPPSATHLVTIQPTVAGSMRSPAAYGLPTEGSELAECLAYLGQRALDNPQVRDAVLATVRALRGQPLNLELDMNEAPVVREEPDPEHYSTRAAAGS